MGSKYIFFSGCNHRYVIFLSFLCDKFNQKGFLLFSLQNNNSMSSLVDWHSIHKTQKDRFGFLLLNNERADVTFIVGEKPGKIEKIPAHTFLLWVGSPVFNGMFNESAKKFCDDSREILIPDIEPAVFHEFLR